MLEGALVIGLDRRVLGMEIDGLGLVEREEHALLQHERQQRGGLLLEQRLGRQQEAQADPRDDVAEVLGLIVGL